MSYIKTESADSPGGFTPTSICPTAKLATYLGRGFTVVTTLQRTVGRAWDLAPRYGVGVLQQSPGQRRTRPRARDPGLCRANRDHAGMRTGGGTGRLRRHRAGLRRDGRPGRGHQRADRGPGGGRRRRRHHDGAIPGRHEMGATSRRGEFARPIPKDVGGLLAGFALGEPAVSGPRVPVGFAAPPLAAPMVGAPGRILPGTAGNRCGRLQVSARRVRATTGRSSPGRDTLTADD